MQMAVSKAKRAANDKWDKANMKVVACKIKKDRAELFRSLCERDGKTANAVLTELIEQYINEHGKENEQ